jgi:hypothetical protein
MPQMNTRYNRELIRRERGCAWDAFRAMCALIVGLVAAALLFRSLLEIWFPLP